MSGIIDGILADFARLGPEGVLAAALLLTIVFGLFRNQWLVKACSIIVYPIMAYWLYMYPEADTSLFNGLLKIDQLSNVLKLLLCLGGWLTVLMPKESKLEVAEYYMLLHAMVLGSFFMVMSAGFITLLLSIEMVSLCGYLIVGIGTSAKRAEGSLKYFIFGTAATAIMIFGISLQVPLTQSLMLVPVTATSPVLVLAGIMILGGLLFKIAAVPYHIWAPDVYAASPLPTLALISVVPKLAGLGLLVRFMATAAHLNLVLTAIALLSIAFGSLAALYQKEVRRMMAWSSVMQTGFLLIPLVIPDIAGPIFVFYALVFALANFLVFYSLQALRADMGTMSDLSGRGKSNLITSIGLLLAFLSLTGIPPTGGFVGKLYIFGALWDQVSTHTYLHLALLITAILSAGASAFFYLKIPYYLFFRPAPEEDSEAKEGALPYVITTLLVLLLLILFFMPHVVA